MRRNSLATGALLLFLALPYPLAQEPAPVAPASPQAPAVAQPSREIPGTLPPSAPQRGAADPQSRTETLQKEISRQIDTLREVFSFTRIFLAIFVFVFTYLLVRVTTFVLERLGRRRTRYASRVRRLVPLVTFGLWIAAALWVASGMFRGSPLSILLLLVVLAVGFIFALQPILKDLVGGIVIILERPFQIGDRVRIGSHYGEVRSIGLRAFQMTSPDGAVLVVPNAEVLRESVSNANPGTVERPVTVEILVPASVDLERARRIAYEAAVVSPYVYSRKPIEIYVDEEFQDELLTKIIVRTHVLDARYENELRSDIMELVRRGFDAAREYRSS